MMIRFILPHPCKMLCLSPRAAASQSQSEGGDSWARTLPRAIACTSGRKPHSSTSPPDHCLVSSTTEPTFHQLAGAG